MKKINFLDLNDLVIICNNLKYAKDIEYDNGHWYGIGSNQLDNIDYSHLYEEFIKLGKEIYDNNKCIKKIQYRDGIQILNCDYLILDKNYYNDSIKESIINWCRKYPVTSKERDSYSSLGHEHQDELEIFILIDISIFSYLVYSSFNNYLLVKEDGKQKDEYDKDIDEYSKGNKIRFNDFMEIGENERDKFLAIITYIINHYETKIYDKTNRPLLQERTFLKYNEISHNCEFTRVFENIYSIFWLLLKGQLYAMSNGNEIFHICRCGKVIPGKAKHCDACLKQIDRERPRRG